MSWFRKMSWFSFHLHVENGTGDYGSSYKSIFNGPFSFDPLIFARDNARENNAPVSVFKGKNIGKLLYTVLPDGSLKTDLSLCMKERDGN